MFSTNRKRMEKAHGCGKVNLHAVLVLVCLFGLLFIAFGSHALAGDTTAVPLTTSTEGSTPTQRAGTDLDFGEVYIYVGGSFPARVHPAAFQYIFDLTSAGNTTGYITPLLFERTSSGTYTVVGIARGFQVELNSLSQTIPYEVIEGTQVTSNGKFTFGFINAIVNASGAPVATSPGVIEYDQPADGGQGEGGPATTNDWVYTDYATASNPVVTLGTTFGPSGSGANYIFNSSRTYSAEAIGTMSPQ